MFLTALPKSKRKLDLLAFADLIAEGRQRSMKIVAQEWHQKLSSGNQPYRKGPTDPAFALLSPLWAVIGVSGTKSSKDAVNIVLELIEDSQGMSLRSILTSIRSEPDAKTSGVDAYLSALKSSIRDHDAFYTTFRQLKADKSLKADDISHLANLFTEVSKKRTRSDALAAIEKKHQYYVEARRSRDAAGGKSAA